MDRARKRRMPAAMALALVAAASVSVAQESPERVRRFESPEVTTGSDPVAFALTPSSLYVARTSAGGLLPPVAIWRLSGPDTNPVLVSDLTSPATGLGDASAAPIAVGETVLVGARTGLWRLDGDGPPRLVHRIAPELLPSARPIGWTGGIALFAVPDATAGMELWRTDGTADGTALLRDIETGPASSYPGRGVLVGSTLFFPATTSQHGTELWRTDATPGGTVLAVDLVPGAGSSHPMPLGRLPGALIARGNDVGGAETVWSTDGTPAGTRVLYRDASAGALHTSGMAYGDRFLLATGNTDTGGALRTTDGTPQGTLVLGSVSPAKLLAEAGGLAYFTVLTAQRVAELWRTDGTSAGTVRVLDLEPGATSGGVTDGVAFGDILVFHAVTTAEGSALWRTDGTAAGTAPLLTKDDGATVVTASGLPNDYYPGLLVATDDAVWFSATGGEGLEVWVTDGTRAGTRAVNLAADRGTGIHEIATSDAALFVAASEQETGREVWVSDGSAAGTSVLSEIAVGAGTSWAAELTDMGDELLFVGGAGDEAGSEIWSATPTSAGAVAVVLDGADRGFAWRLHRVGDLAYFRGSFASQETAWRTDGTLAGTIELGGAEPYRFLDVGGAALFFSRDGINHHDLWRSDGTAAGTRLVQDLTPPTGQTAASVPVVLGATLFFGAAGNASGNELWRSDGTAAGTAVDADLVPGSGGSGPTALTAVGDRLFFTASDGTGGRSLFVRAANGQVTRAWDGRSDPTAFPEGGIGLGDDLLFVATDAAHGRELWRTDGTPQGTSLVRDIAVGAPWSSPSRFVAVGGGRVVFVADDGVHGNELWTTDGTEAGTLPVADLVTGPGSSDPAHLTILGDDIYLAANGDGAASDLWRIPLALLDELDEPDPLPVLEPLVVLPPEGPEPTPPMDPPPVDPPTPDPDPEPLALDALHVNLDTARSGHDTLLVKVRLPLDGGLVTDGLPLRVDVGGVVVDVTLDERGRATSDEGARVRLQVVKPRRRKDEPTEVRATVRLRRADLAARLADEDLAVPAGERRAVRSIDLEVLWRDVAHAATATVRSRERRGVVTAKLVDPD